MPIPDAERAIAADEKVRDYLLNLELSILMMARRRSGFNRSVMLAISGNCWRTTCLPLPVNVTNSIPKQRDLV